MRIEPDFGIHIGGIKIKKDLLRLPLRRSQTQLLPIPANTSARIAALVALRSVGTVAVFESPVVWQTQTPSGCIIIGGITRFGNIAGTELPSVVNQPAVGTGCQKGQEAQQATIKTVSVHSIWNIETHLTNASNRNGRCR